MSLTKNRVLYVITTFCVWFDTICKTHILQCSISKRFFPSYIHHSIAVSSYSNYISTAHIFIYFAKLLKFTSSQISHSTLCYSRQDSHYRKVHTLSKGRFCPRGTPPYQTHLAMHLQGLGEQFSPVHFQRLLPRWVRFYALFK